MKIVKIERTATEVIVYTDTEDIFYCTLEDAEDIKIGDEISDDDIAPEE